MNETFPLYAKTVVVTGKFESYTRFTLLAMLAELGAIPHYQVSSKTDVLIVGTKPGRKLKCARDLGISILSEVEFEDMLAQAGQPVGEQLCLLRCCTATE